MPMAYFVLLALVLIWIIVHKICRLPLLVPIFFMLALFAGLRSSRVGTDSPLYVSFFERSEGIMLTEDSEGTAMENGSRFLNFAISEPGFGVLCFIAHLFSDKYPALFLSIAILTVACYLISIHRYSEDEVISVISFITLGFYTFFFNGARQGMAAAVYSLSFGALINRKFLVYCLWVLAASMFHRTILVAIPLYFLFTRPNNWFTMLILIAGGTLAAKFLGVVMTVAAETVSQRYATYTDVEFSSGELYTALYSVIAASLFIAKRFIVEEDWPVYDVWLNMVIFGAMVYVAVMIAGLNQQTQRLGFYFLAAICYVMPIVFRNLERYGLGDCARMVYVFLNLAYMFVIVHTGRVDTYQLNEWIRF